MGVEEDKAGEDGAMTAPDRIYYRPKDDFVLTHKPQMPENFVEYMRAEPVMEMHRYQNKVVNRLVTVLLLVIAYISWVIAGAMLQGGTP